MNPPTERITIPHAPEFFPATALVQTRLWAGLTAPAKAVLVVLWDFHRQYPDACHPSRKTLADLAGISGPSVTRALSVLEDIGIVQTIPTPGPRANTYRIQWSGLLAPQKSKSAKGTPSPYQRPRADRDLYMGVDDEGNQSAKYERRGGGFHPLADGCRVRGSIELVIHDLLVAWGVPHWPEVKYADLGIEVRHQGSGDINRHTSVDFVVAPGLLIERLGLSSTQNQAKKYRAKAKAKMDAARKAGWEVLVVEPDERPGPALFEHIRRAWAKASVQDAKRLREALRRAGKHVATHRPSRMLDTFIEDAEARLHGDKDPRKSRGLTMNIDGPHGFPVTHPCEPVLVLMERAGVAVASDEGQPLVVSTNQPPVVSTNREADLRRLEEVEREIVDLVDNMLDAVEPDEEQRLRERYDELEHERQCLEQRWELAPASTSA